jgi:phosphoribosyl-ATP pyrophosphohydrolase
LVNEVADLWFHTMVMLAHLDLDHTAVLNVLDARMGLSGLAEKAARKGHNAGSEDA